MTDAAIRKEIQALQALGAEMVKRTSRLEEELAPVQGRVPRKGPRKLSFAEKAVLRRQQFIAKKSAR